MNDNPGTEDSKDPGPGVDRGWGHRVLDFGSRAWGRTWKFLKWWGPLAGSWMLALIAMLLIFWNQGVRPIGFGLVAGLILAIVTWFVIKVHYTYVIAVKVDERGTLTMKFYDVPIEIAGEIEIEGSVAWCRDRSGRQLRIVESFDPVTRNGVGTWPVLTPVEVAANWDAAKKTVVWTQAMIRKYGIANVTAKLDAAGDYMEVANFANNLLGIPHYSVSELLEEERKRTGGSDDRPIRQ